jgi:NAD(P)-dependent dehydrogenase (short-subunit alcohol dehydrogenase family)
VSGLGLLALDGRRALVTGGGIGLGHHMALGLAEAGADVVICGRREDVLEQCAQEIRAFGRDATVIRADITQEDDLQRLVAGAGQIDILLNNAGIGLLRPWDEITREEWHAVMALNVDALYRLCQLVGPGMLSRGWGRIINVSSVYGLISGDPNRYPPEMRWDNPAYVVSKHAVEGITHYLGTRFAQHGVTVNSICPGMFPSEQGAVDGFAEGWDRPLIENTPARRLGRFEDLNAAAVFLASPGSSFVTGQSIVVDGGWTAW